MATNPKISEFIELTKLIKLCGETVKRFNTEPNGAGRSRIDEIAEIIDSAAAELLKIAKGELLASGLRYDDPSSYKTHGFAVTDLTGSFVNADRRYCEIVGYPLSQLSEMSILSITHEGDRENNRLLLEELLNTGKAFEIKKRYIRSDKSLLWVRNEVSRLEGSSQAVLLAKCSPLLDKVTISPLLA